METVPGLWLYESNSIIQGTFGMKGSQTQPYNKMIAKYDEVLKPYLD